MKNKIDSPLYESLSPSKSTSGLYDSVKLIIDRYSTRKLTSNAMQPVVGAAGMRYGSEG